MIPKIRSIAPLGDFRLDVLFDDGKRVVYDMKEDIQTLPSYIKLKDVEGLFEKVRLDESRTCISWNEEIDLPSDTLYEYGIQK